MENDKNFKICVTGATGNIDGEIDSRFGRCEYFLFVDIEVGQIKNVEVKKNAGAEAEHGAGIGAAEQVGKEGVKVIITGDLGPKAMQVVEELGIEVYRASGKIKKAIEDYLTGKTLSSAEDESSKEMEASNKISGEQRIFIPLMNDDGENSEISLHFGHAPYFGLYEIASGQLEVKENDLNHSDPGKSPVDQIMESVNPTIVFAQDMGTRAINLFTEKGIVLKTGPYKTVKEVIENLDNLSNLTDGCSH